MENFTFLYKYNKMPLIMLYSDFLFLRIFISLNTIIIIICYKIIH